MKTIIFDMYGVIIKESKGNFIPYVYSRFPNTDRAKFSAFSKAQLGEINSNEFLSSLGFSDTECHMKDYIENHLTMDQEFYGFADKYKDKYHYALLSNDVLAWNEYILKYHGLSQYFNHCVVSAIVHARKPDAEIYEKALHIIGTPAENCIFIDNSVKNLLVAQKLGMDIILFNRDKEEFDGKIVYSFGELEKYL